MITTLMSGLACFTMLNSAAAGESPFAGVWRGSVNNLPAIELTIEDNAGTPGGSIVFYFQRRTPEGKWRVEGGRNPILLLAVSVKGKSLSFEVLHHKRHGSPELGPNAKFRIELTGPGQAALFKTDEASDGGPGLPLIRQNEIPRKTR
jgi:hypothetical protein